MEKEVYCPFCCDLFTIPVLLSCRHSLCLACAIYIQKPSEQRCINTNGNKNGNALCNNTSNSVATGIIRPEEVSEGAEPLELDKLSLQSDSDSGVSCSSRPISILSVTDPASGGSHSDASSHYINDSFSIECPTCKTLTLTGNSGAYSLQHFKILYTVIEKYKNKLNIPDDVQNKSCQICRIICKSNDNSECQNATHFCDQCYIFYCDKCFNEKHSQNEAYINHVGIGVSLGLEKLKLLDKDTEKCQCHSEDFRYYCDTCRCYLCNACLNQSHKVHDIHYLESISKKHKTELSQLLQSLSEKAKTRKHLVQQIQKRSKDIDDDFAQVDESLSAQIDLFIKLLCDRKEELKKYLLYHRDCKVMSLENKIEDYTEQLHTATSTLQFCIEAIRESGFKEFMEAKEVLEGRIKALSHDLEFEESDEQLLSLNLTLDHAPLMDAIQNLTFLQLKVPGSPYFIPEECISENNSIALSWKAHGSSYTEGFVLQIDDGCNGEFKDVYNGQEKICTIDGLHFSSMYRARVKAYNSVGESSFSEFIHIQTAEGSVGFSRGHHYWQFVIEEYDGHKDVAFGVAQRDIPTEKILGKCQNGWSMYIDGQRSWLMHGGDHFGRASGGIKKSDKVGVHLDLISGSLTFYVNNAQQGSMIIAGRHGVLYPAVSLTRGVRLILISGLQFSKQLDMIY